MKFLVVGLGNMGPEYVGTRHNIGFDAVERLAGATPFVQDKHGLLAETSYRGRKLLLLKPNTYMNLSGKAISYHLQAHKIHPDQLLVITDDIALPFGTLRLRGKGSAGGHNGLKHIIETLGHENWARLRLGVGAAFAEGRQVDYVLGKFSAAEQKNLPAVLDAAVQAAQTFAFQGLNEAMTRSNRNVVATTQPAQDKSEQIQECKE